MDAAPVAVASWSMSEAGRLGWLADLVKVGAAEFDAEPVGECVVGL
jgi:hypothetical protein